MIFQPNDLWEVVTPFGEGVVLYVDRRGQHSNDVWCVADKENGQLRHFSTIQLKLAKNSTLDINDPDSLRPYR